MTNNSSLDTCNCFEYGNARWCSIHHFVENDGDTTPSIKGESN